VQGREDSADLFLSISPSFSLVTTDSAKLFSVVKRFLVSRFYPRFGYPCSVLCLLFCYCQRFCLKLIFNVFPPRLLMYTFCRINISQWPPYQSVNHSFFSTSTILWYLNSNPSIFVPHSVSKHGRFNSGANHPQLTLGSPRSPEQSMSNPSNLSSTYLTT
jgi:hypothetical protein